MKSKTAKIREILEIVDKDFRKKEYRLPPLHLVREGDPLPPEYEPGDIVVYCAKEPPQ